MSLFDLGKLSTEVTGIVEDFRVELSAIRTLLERLVEMEEERSDA